MLLTRNMCRKRWISRQWWRNEVAEVKRVCRRFWSRPPSTVPTEDIFPHWSGVIRGGHWPVAGTPRYVASAPRFFTGYRRHLQACRRHIQAGHWLCQTSHGGSQMLPGASKVHSCTPRCSQTYHNHLHGTPVPVIRDSGHFEIMKECRPQVWYSPENNAFNFTLHSLAETPGGFQWQKFILLICSILHLNHGRGI